MFDRQEYENIWLDDRNELGINITSTNREVILSDMEEAIRNRKVTVNSDRLVKELLSFEINKNGRVEAAKGHHDDLISSLSLAVKGLNQLLEKSPTLVTTLKRTQPEPLTISERQSYSGKHFKGLPIEDVKWILGKNN